MLFRRLLRTSVHGFAKAKDYYNVLGLQKGASAADIKKAYVKLAREYHPDRNTAPNAKEKFTEVSEAYQTLSDDKKRAVYDSYGMGADEQKQYENTGFGGAPDFGNFADFFGNSRGGFGNFEDFFSSGGEGKQRRSVRGADLMLNIEIDFMEAVNGVRKEVTFRVADVCQTCKGSKCKPGTSPTRCTACGGKGTLNLRQGPMFIQMGCSVCHETGTEIKSPCSACKATGVGQKTTREQIDIPRGINSGQSLRMSGKGSLNEGGGQRGDLIIKVNVKPDKYFRREEYNVVTDLMLTVSQAVLGTEAEVRTLTGTRKVRVNPSTSHGTKIRIPGEGIHKLAPNDREKGDHYVVVNVSIPTRLSTEQRRLYEQLKAIDETAQKADKKA